MDICGIDYSTHYVDIVRIRDDGSAWWNRYALSGADSFDRARTVCGTIPGRASSFWDQVLAVGIEEPAGRKPGHLFRIQGGVLACLPPRMLVEKWMPSQWRKAVGFPGNCSKDYVREQVNGAFLMAMQPSWPSDSCDAYCIALATQKALDRQAVPVQPSDEHGLEEQ